MEGESAPREGEPSMAGAGARCTPLTPPEVGGQLKDQGFPAGLAGPGLCPRATSVAQQCLERLWDQILDTSRAGHQF